MVYHIIFLVLIFFSDFIINNIRLKNRRKIEVIVVGILIFLFAALRAPEIGVDIPGYCKDYLIDAKLSMKEIFLYRQGRDPVFHVFIKLLSYISRDPQFMLAVVGAVEAISLSIFAYHQKGNLLLFYLLFIGLRIFPFTLSGLRQTMAMSICWLAFVQLQKGKKLRFCLITLLACLFHATAIVSILILPICLMKNNKLFYSGLGVFSILYILVGNTLFEKVLHIIMPGRFNGYISRAEAAGFDLGMTNILYILFFAFCVFAYWRNRKNNTDLEPQLRLSSVVVVVTLISTVFPNMFRIGYYFVIFLLPLFSESVRRTFVKSQYRLICFVMSAMLFAQYIILGPGANTDMYRFFWQG